MPTGTLPDPDSVDFAALYDKHPEYIARRDTGSFEQVRTDLVVRLFKLPGLLGVLPATQKLRRVVEIGCATGELIAAVPVESGGERVGLDIAPANIAAARLRFPSVHFLSGDFRVAGLLNFDAVIISDVLEHVSDDAAFLRDAARLGDIALVNLPLEDNWFNARRAYGPDDVSGHLRRYSLHQGLALFDRAGVEVLKYERIWLHETPAESAYRALRREWQGSAYSGMWPMALVRSWVSATATVVRPVGRRVFSSNLFAAARLGSTR
jgi:SAM-dependent methyltransferase